MNSQDYAEPENQNENTEAADRDDTGIGILSEPNGGGGGGRHGDDPEGLGGGSNFGSSGSNQGSDITPYGRSSTKHSTGHGRDTPGAFGEEGDDANANRLNDIRDAGISRNEIGPSNTEERTSGGGS